MLLILIYLFIYQSASNRGFLRAYYIVRIDLSLCQVFLPIPIPGKRNGGIIAAKIPHIFYLTKITFLLSVL